jgi:hypothetical protein
MVTCDSDQPPNNECSPFALLNITPRLAMAEIFGTKLIRCQIKRPEQLGWAQRACDEAKERGMSIIHLSHPASLFSNVDDAIDSLKKINRSNFGLTYEPVNWMDHRKGYGPDVIKSVAPWIVNVYSQNQKAVAQGTAPAAAAPRGPAGGPPASGGRGYPQSGALGARRRQFRRGVSGTARDRLHRLLYGPFENVGGHRSARSGDQKLRVFEAVQRRRQAVKAI